MADPLFLIQRRLGEFLPLYKIPRQDMPQLTPDQYPKLRMTLAQRWVPSGDLRGDVRLFRAHQDVDPVKAMEIPPAVLAIPIVVSSDLWIIDGNHRWFAHALNRQGEYTPIDAFMIGMKFGLALDFCLRFGEGRR